MFDIIQTANDFGVCVGWAISRRKEFLNQRIAFLKTELDKALQTFAGRDELNRFFLLDSVKSFEKEIKKLKLELHFKNTKKGDRITQSDIESARKYPIKSLLMQNIKGGKTHCISGTHKDEHPSMDIRHNFAHCYSCGFQGDSITVYRKLHNVDFITSVTALNSL